jgi:DNA-binding transcriptional LysR family regulator
VPWNPQIRRRLKLRELDILMTVVRAGGMRKAADHLHMSQPAVSKAIADLERTLGVPLLDRTPRGVEPTQYGRALLKRGIAVFDELKQGVQDIDFLADPEAGELRIGSSTAQAEGIVLAVIDRLSRRYPRVVFHVVQGGTLAQYDELRERRVELGVVRLFGTATAEDVEEEVLFEEPMVVVAGTQNPWARRRKIQLAELVNEPWTWPSAGTMINSLIVEAFRATGLEPPRATVYIDATNMRIRLAATGRFLAVMPAGVLRSPAKHAAIKMLPVDLPPTHGPIGIITLKNRTLSPLAQLFIECAREVGKSLAKGR